MGSSLCSRRRALDPENVNVFIVMPPKGTTADQLTEGIHTVEGLSPCHGVAEVSPTTGRIITPQWIIDEWNRRSETQQVDDDEVFHLDGY